MKILQVRPEAVGGVEYYRLDIPHMNLGNDFNWEVTTTKTLDTDEPLAKHIEGFDVVVFSRLISSHNNTEHIVDEVHKTGAKVVLDLDDYWLLPRHHLLWGEYGVYNVAKKTTEAIGLADAVTVTTPHLEKKVKPYNKNVYILENAIDFTQEQWQIDKQTDEIPTVGWVGGIHHIKDLKMVRNDFYQLATSDLEHRLIYAGYNDQKAHKEIESIISADHKNKNYLRFNALDVYNYGQFYNYLDIAIAPLHNNDFNQCKSELKAIEAGAKKCAFIGSNIPPYTYLCDETNSILTRKHWFEKIKLLCEEKNLREDLAEKLHEDVKAKHDIKVVNEKRKFLYENL